VLSRVSVLCSMCCHLLAYGDLVGEKCSFRHVSCLDRSDRVTFTILHLSEGNNKFEFF
jgi:hypothetical protein